MKKNPQLEPLNYQGGLDGGNSTVSGGGGNVFPEREDNFNFDPEFIQQQDAQFNDLVMNEVNGQ